MERFGQGEYAPTQVRWQCPSHAHWTATPQGGRKRRTLAITGTFVLAVAATVLIQSGSAAPPPENVAPEIESFEAANVLDNVWEFRGDIVDEEPDACVINFGKLLDGHSVDVNSDGSFSYSLELDPDEEGVVSAQAVDPEGLESEVAEDTVVQ